jgi:hypothetical protein
MPAGIYAVLIADVMQSSSRRDLRGILGQKLGHASKRHLRKKLIKLPYSVTAGDEFQTVIASLATVPEIVMGLRVIFQPLALRIGIGLGHIPGRIQPPVNQLGGEAFRFARHAIESVKNGTLFKFDSLTEFASRNERFDQTINLIYGLQDTLVRKITAKQWVAIEALTDNPGLAQAAKRLHLDVSTVSRNLKRGYYWQLSETVRVAGSFIEHTFQ